MWRSLRKSIDLRSIGAAVSPFNTLEFWGSAHIEHQRIAIHDHLARLSGRGPGHGGVGRLNQFLDACCHVLFLVGDVLIAMTAVS